MMCSAHLVYGRGNCDIFVPATLVFTVPRVSSTPLATRGTTGMGRLGPRVEHTPHRTPHNIIQWGGGGGTPPGGRAGIYHVLILPVVHPCVRADRAGGPEVPHHFVCRR